MKPQITSQLMLRSLQLFIYLFIKKYLLNTFYGHAVH